MSPDMKKKINEELTYWKLDSSLQKVNMSVQSTKSEKLRKPNLNKEKLT